MSMTLGQKLRQARKACGMTQEQLAQSLFVTRQTISSWENDRTQPDYEVLQKLMELLHTEEEKAEPAGMDAEPVIPQPVIVQPEAVSVPGKLKVKRILLLAAVLAAVLLCVAFLPNVISRAQYPALELFQQETPQMDGLAYLRLLPGETPLKAFSYPEGTPPRWSTRIYLREMNGVGVTVERITTYLFEKNWLGHCRAVSRQVYSEFDIAHQMGSEYIGPEQLRMILCDVTADSKTVGMGVEIETVDEYENEQIFRVYLPFEQV